MISAVIDTNVLVSAFWSFGKDTPPMRILRALVNGTFTAVVSGGIVEEYREVLRRKKFAFDETDVNALLEFIVRHSIWVTPTETDAPVADPKDKVFYSSALAENGAKVVTGNLKHFPKTPIVVSPTEFCTILGI